MKRWLRSLLVIAALLCALPAKAGDDGKIAAAGRRVRALAARLQAALDPDQCQSVTSCRVTMAAGMLDDGTILIATSEEGNRRRSPIEDIRRQEGAEWVSVGGGHAEEKIINYPSTTLFRRNRKVLVVAAGRPICQRCESIILAAGAKPASPCVSGKTY